MVSALHVAELSALALVSTAFIWWGGETPEETSDEFASYYCLPLVVQGAPVAAPGPSFPALSGILDGDIDSNRDAVYGERRFCGSQSSGGPGTSAGGDR